MYSTSTFHNIYYISRIVGSQGHGADVLSCNFTTLSLLTFSICRCWFTWRDRSNGFASSDYKSSGNPSLRVTIKRFYRGRVCYYVTQSIPSRNLFIFALNCRIFVFYLRCVFAWFDNLVPYMRQKMPDSIWRCADINIIWHLWPLLLTWIHFNPSMDK